MQMWGLLMKNKRLIVKIFFFGIITYFFIDFIMHARIMVVYPLRLSFIFVILIFGIVIYLFSRFWKK